MSNNVQINLFNDEIFHDRLSCRPTKTKHTQYFEKCLLQLLFSVRVGIVSIESEPRIRQKT